MNHKIDPNYNAVMASKNVKGVVGENAIWDGPLDQTGRPHGMGASNGITGMRLKHAGVPYKGLNAVLCAQGKKY
jgi:hypothetical protein